MWAWVAGVPVGPWGRGDAAEGWLDKGGNVSRSEVDGSDTTVLGSFDYKEGGEKCTKQIVRQRDNGKAASGSKSRGANMKRRTNWLVVGLTLLIAAMVIGQQAAAGGKDQARTTRAGQDQLITAEGVIKSAEAQGNNYMALAIVTGKEAKPIRIWCHGAMRSSRLVQTPSGVVEDPTLGTRVFYAGKEVEWYELEPGRNVRVTGIWSGDEAGPMLSANRIDILGKGKAQTGVTDSTSRNLSIPKQFQGAWDTVEGKVSRCKYGPESDSRITITSADIRY